MRNTPNAWRYTICFITIALILFVIAIGLAWFYRPLSGDLTRIGNWSESDFGPTYIQASLPAAPTGAIQPQSSSGLLVLGDSFSHPNIWQSHFSKLSSWPTYSFQYKNVGCVDNWLNWLAVSNNTGSRIVVMQVVERSFLAVFRNQRTCLPGKVHTAIQPENSPPAKVEIRRLDLDAEYLFKTSLNTLRMRFQNGRLTSGGVVNVPLSSGAFFSNKISNRLLYYAEDDIKNSWRKSDIDSSIQNIKMIQSRLADLNMRLVLVVVPDKSSVYRPYMQPSLAAALPPPNIFASLAHAGLDSVDLSSVFAQKLGKSIDLYLPNDTHLSDAGYKLMGEAVADAIVNKPQSGVQ